MTSTLPLFYNVAMRRKFFIGLVFLFATAAFLGSCKRTPDPITKTSFKLNTVVTITLYDSQDVSLLEEAMALCDYYEMLFSRTREGSEIYQVNQGTRSQISDPTAELLSIALSYAELSGGRLDPTIGAVSSLWDFHAEEPVLPDAAQLTAALPMVGYEKVSLSDHTVTLAEPGMRLDLGAIAKGYIADRIKDYLVEHKVTSAIIDLGGNVLCIGSRPDGSPFQIGVRQPFADNAVASVASLEIRDRSVVTSGIYERCFELDGVLYHHLLDPKTGFPCSNELASVTIISDCSVDGDALSTTCYLLGLEKGLEFISARDDAQAIFITKDNEIFYSDSFDSAIQK